MLNEIAALPSPAIAVCVNAGYLSSGIFDNWLASVYRLNLRSRIIVGALDRFTFERVSALGIRCILWEGGPLGETSFEAIQYRTEGWKPIVFSKVSFVREILLAGRDVLFSDSDVVFLRDPFPVLAKLPTLDFLIQSDARFSVKNADLSTLCSGFYFVRSTPSSIGVLSTNDSECLEWGGDQDMFRSRIFKQGLASARLLPRQLFPNGSLWLNAPPDDPVAVHFNWLVGTRDKIKAMKATGVWLGQKAE